MGKFADKVNHFKNTGKKKDNVAYEQLINVIDNVDSWLGCSVIYGRIDIKVGLPEELYRWMDGKILKLEGVELYKNTASTSIVSIDGNNITPSMDIDRFFKDLIDQLKERIVEI